MPRPAPYGPPLVYPLAQAVADGHAQPFPTWQAAHQGPGHAITATAMDVTPAVYRGAMLHDCTCGARYAVLGPLVGLLRERRAAAPGRRGPS